MPAILAFLPTESPEHLRHIPENKNQRILWSVMAWVGNSNGLFVWCALQGVADKDAQNRRG